MRSTTPEIKSAPKDNYYDVVIVGAGLAGLMDAVKASRARLKVLVIEQREEKYSSMRPQMIALSYKVVNELYCLDLLTTIPSEKELKKDNEFRNRLKTTLEKMVYHTLNDLDNYLEHFQIKDIQTYLKFRTTRHYCTIYYDSKVLEIQLSQGRLLVEKSHELKVITFKDIVLAEGVKRETAISLLHLEYQPVTRRQEIHHVSGYFTVESKNKKPIPIKTLFPEKPIGIIVDGKYAGYIYYEQYTTEKNQNLKVKFNIVMHIPDELVNKFRTDQNFGTAYLKHCIAAAFNQNEYNIEITKSKLPEKDKLKYLSFDLDFMEAKIPAFVENGHTLIQTGDGQRSADFYLAHGGDNAITDAEEVLQLLLNKIDVDEFNQIAMLHSKIISEQTKRSTPMDYQDTDWPIFYVSPFVYTEQPEFDSERETKLENSVDPIAQLSLSVLSQEAFDIFYSSTELIQKSQAQIIHEMNECSHEFDNHMNDLSQYISYRHSYSDYFKNDIVRIYYLATALNQTGIIEKIQASAKTFIDNQLQKISAAFAMQPIDFNLLVVRFKQVIYFSSQFDLFDVYKEKILKIRNQITEGMLTQERLNTGALHEFVKLLNQAGLLESSAWEELEAIKKDKRKDYSFSGRYEYGKILCIQEEIRHPSNDISFLDWVSQAKSKLSENAVQHGLINRANTF